MNTYRVTMKDGGTSFIHPAESEAAAKEKAVKLAKDIAKVSKTAPGATKVLRVEKVS